MPYDVEGKKLYKTLVIEYAKQKKEIQMNFISNGEFNEQEFTTWKTKMLEAKKPLPTQFEVKQQAKKIRDLISKEYTSKDLTDIYEQNLKTKIEKGD